MSWKWLAIVGTFVVVACNEEVRKYQQYDESTELKRKAPKGEVVVEKFVETLMNSEKYLKMIEAVEKKLHHLDTSFHDRSNVIMKYMVELLKVMKSNSPEESEKLLGHVKSDIDKIYNIISDKDSPVLRADYGHDSAVESRLGGLETSIKNIQTGVDTVVSIINEVKNRRFPKGSKQDDNQLSGTLDALGLITEFRKSLAAPKKKCDCSRSGGGRIDRSERFPSDCYEIQMQGFNISGIYKIKPDDSDPFYVLCDLVTAGGGWTVFQNRFDGTQDFYKGWSDYKHGFGNLAGEFWLGLEKLSYLTNQKLYELRVEMGAGHGQEGYAGYSVFTVGPEHESYRISTLGTYRGNAGDSLTYHAGQKFSTHDVDNDEWSDGSCSSEHGGAWWYKECDKSNLNGKYTMSPDENRGQTMYWISFKGPTTPLMKTKMMIRPLPATRPTENDHVRKLEFSNTRISPEKQVLRGSSKRPVQIDVSGSRPYRYDQMKNEPFFQNYA